MESGGRYCALGMVQRIARDDPTTASRAINELGTAARTWLTAKGNGFGPSADCSSTQLVAWVNDEYGYREVLEVFDLALDRVEWNPGRLRTPAG